MEQEPKQDREQKERMLRFWLNIDLGPVSTKGKEGKGKNLAQPTKPWKHKL